jgi:hypothetical protein
MKRFGALDISRSVSRSGWLSSVALASAALVCITPIRSQTPPGELTISPADVGLVGKETFYTFSALFADTAVPCFETTGLFFSTQFGLRINVPIARMDYKVAVKRNEDNVSTNLTLFNETCMYEIRVSRKKKVGEKWVDDTVRVPSPPK